MLFAFSFFHLELSNLVPGFTSDNYRQVVHDLAVPKFALNTVLIAGRPRSSRSPAGTSSPTSWRSARGARADPPRGGRDRADGELPRTDLLVEDALGARAASSIAPASVPRDAWAAQHPALLPGGGHHGGGELLPAVHDARAVLEPDLDSLRAGSGRARPRSVEMDDAPEDHAPAVRLGAVRRHPLRLLPLGRRLHHAGVPRGGRLERDVRHVDLRSTGHDAQLPARSLDRVRDARRIPRGSRGAPARDAIRRPASEAHG